MRRVKFKPGLRQQLTTNAAYLAAMSPGGTLPADLQRSLDATMPAPKKKRAEPRQLEAPLVAAIKQLLAHHPKVLWALRVNSGSASYEAKSGKWAPVKFHEWLRYPMPMRMPDFFGMLNDGRIFGLEAKNRIGLSQQTNASEIKRIFCNVYGRTAV